MATKYAIDLGTTNTIIARCEDNIEGGLPDVIVMEISQYDENFDFISQRKLASKIYISENQERILGNDAIKRVLARGEAKHVVQNMKLFMGKDPEESTITLRDGATKINHIDAASIIINHIKNYALNGIQVKPYERMVVTVPALFGKVANAQTKQAVLDTGIVKPVNLHQNISEPTAAILNYVRKEWAKKHHQTDKFVVDETVMVLDIGGGTTDVNTIHMKLTADFKGEFPLVAANKSRLLGGVHFDLAIVRGLLCDYFKCEPDALAQQLGVTNEIMDFNAAIVSDIKEKIIGRYNKSVDIYRNPDRTSEEKFSLYINDNEKRNFKLNYDKIVEFTESIWSYAHKTNKNQYNIFHQIESGISNIIDIENYGDFSKDDITMVYLTGGTSQFKVIRHEIEKYFEGNDVKIVSSDEVYYDIAKGAAFYLYLEDQYDFSRQTAKNIDALPNSYFIAVKNQLPFEIYGKGNVKNNLAKESTFKVNNTNKGSVYNIPLIEGDDIYDPKLCFTSLFKLQLTKNLDSNKITLRTVIQKKDDFQINVVNDIGTIEDKTGRFSGRFVFSYSDFSRVILDEIQFVVKTLPSFDKSTDAKIYEIFKEDPEIPLLELYLYLLNTRNFETVTAKERIKIIKAISSRIFNAQVNIDVENIKRSIDQVLHYWYFWGTIPIDLAEILIYSRNKDLMIEYLSKVFEYERKYTDNGYQQILSNVYDLLRENNESWLALEHVFLNHDPKYLQHVMHWRDRDMKNELNKTLRACSVEPFKYIEKHNADFLPYVEVDYTKIIDQLNAGSMLLSDFAEYIIDLRSDDRQQEFAYQLRNVNFNIHKDAELEDFFLLLNATEAKLSDTVKFVMLVNFAENKTLDHKLSKYAHMFDIIDDNELISLLLNSLVTKQESYERILEELLRFFKQRYKVRRSGEISNMIRLFFQHRNRISDRLKKSMSTLLFENTISLSEALTIFEGIPNSKNKKSLQSAIYHQFKAMWASKKTSDQQVLKRVIRSFRIFKNSNKYDKMKRDVHIYVNGLFQYSSNGTPQPIINELRSLSNKSTNQEDLLET